MSEASTDSLEDQSAPTLSARELELVQLLARGLSNREIAQELVISPNTVKVHLRNIYSKLDVSSRTEATMAALRFGWIEVDTPSPEPLAPTEQPVPQQSTATAQTPPAESLVPQTPARAAPQPLAPLATWQRVYLILSLLLVALGLWVTWPDDGDRSGPFTDRPASASSQPPGPVARWGALAQMPTPRARLAVVAYHDHIYAIGGESLSGISSFVEIYMPDEDDWRRGADMPTAVANVGAAELASRLYVPGGTTADGQISDLLQVYDPSAGEEGVWTSAAPLPKGLSAYAIAAHEDALYLFGGWDGRSYITATYKYDLQRDAWSSLAPMSTPRAFSGAGRIGNRIYVVGGYDGEKELDVCEVYEPALDRWSKCPSLNAPRGGIGVAVIADTLYAIGGGWQSYLVENEILSVSDDAVQGAWRTFPSPLLQEWRNMGVAANGTSIYAIGGWDGGFLGDNQTYRAIFRLYLPNMPFPDKNSSGESKGQ
jgi:DNA-binding CsgD family transcriptional regulator